METTAVLFTRDLRVHDHPALAAAARRGHVAPLFVVDDAILASGFAVPNRASFLVESLRDLDASLSARGARLAVRRGDVVAETIRFARAAGATRVVVGRDVSAYAQARERRLRAACDAERLAFETSPSITIHAPDAIATLDGGAFKVFTPYWRRWREAPRRGVESAPRTVTAPPVDPGTLPSLADLTPGTPSPELAPGGEAAGRERMRAWLRRGLAGYGELRQELAADATSRLSPYLHFGCVSALELAEAALGNPGGEPFVRQLAWRDFYAQLLAAFPGLPRKDLHPRGDEWADDDESLDAWKQGRTGYPVVDAGMRQLAREGWLPNRARLIVASFLCKDLYVDWRAGARHFFDLLVDGDVANNSANWQWVAGTGVDMRPHRVYNPTLQAQRHDPNGDYVRRHVPELAGIDGPGVHEPWRLRGSLLDPRYPEPVVDHRRALERFRSARKAASTARSGVSA